jgi:uncharacterized protein (UPF0264 family)
MVELLVSVRSVPEALAALEGGADLIDVKEPTRGSLGRADQQTTADIVGCLAGRRPVSAALGELLETPGRFSVPGVGYAKWGLARCSERRDWQRLLAEAADRLRDEMPGCRLVPVAYADHVRASAPSTSQVLRFARRQGCAALLLDTFRKDGRSLLDWMSVRAVCHLCRACHAAGIRIAVAGSLGAAEIRALLPAEPDWFAVRGAVCRGDRRTSSIDPIRVHRLAELLSLAGSRLGSRSLGPPAGAKLRGRRGRSWWQSNDRPARADQHPTNSFPRETGRI